MKRIVPIAGVAIICPLWVHLPIVGKYCRIFKRNELSFDGYEYNVAVKNIQSTLTFRPGTGPSLWERPVPGRNVRTNFTPFTVTFYSYILIKHKLSHTQQPPDLFLLSAVVLVPLNFFFLICGCVYMIARNLTHSIYVWSPLWFYSALRQYIILSPNHQSLHHGCTNTWTCLIYAMKKSALE